MSGRSWNACEHSVDGKSECSDQTLNRALSVRNSSSAMRCVKLETNENELRISFEVDMGFLLPGKFVMDENSGSFFCWSFYDLLDRS